MMIGKTELIVNFLNICKMGVWDDIDMTNFDGGEKEPDEKLKQLLSRSHNQLVGNYLRSIAHKGKVVSEETRKKLSERMTGKKLSEEHKENLKLQKLIHKVDVEEIKRLQQECDTANEVAQRLGMTWHTYKRIATELGVYKKLELSERNKRGGNPILVWKYDPNQPEGKGEFMGEFRTQNEAMAFAGLKMSIKPVLEGKYKQANGYFFQKKFG